MEMKVCKSFCLNKHLSCFLNYISNRKILNVINKFAESEFNTKISLNFEIKIFSLSFRDLNLTTASMSAGNRWNFNGSPIRSFRVSCFNGPLKRRRWKLFRIVERVLSWWLEKSFENPLPIQQFMLSQVPAITQNSHQLNSTWWFEHFSKHLLRAFMMFLSALYIIYAVKTHTKRHKLSSLLTFWRMLASKAESSHTKKHCKLVECYQLKVHKRNDKWWWFVFQTIAEHEQEQREICELQNFIKNIFEKKVFGLIN